METNMRSHISEYVTNFSYQPALGAPATPAPRDRDRFYMGVAEAVREGADCLRRHVGAIVVVERHIVSDGYNGTPIGAVNCSVGGCDRCAGKAKPGEQYEACACVHAEANALLLAARHGSSTDGGILYTTMLPCLSCLKSAVQAGIVRIVAPRDDTLAQSAGQHYWELAAYCNVLITSLEV